MNISELRKQYQMSQDDFANIFHVSRQTVSNWENGKSYPDVEMLVKISDYFGISVDQLIKKETIPSVAKNSDKQKKLWLMLAVIATVVCLIGAFFLYNYNEEHSVKFSMKKDKTYGQSATSQKLYFKKGSYQVQITANHYHEKVVSLDYNVSVKG